MVFTPALITGMPFAGDRFKSVSPRIFSLGFFLFSFGGNPLPLHLFGFIALSTCLSKRYCRPDAKGKPVFFFVGWPSVLQMPVL